MEKFNMLFTGGIRYILPVFALIIIATCVISLFRNRPRLHKLAQLVNQKDGTVIDIDRWETSIGKSRQNDIVLSQENISRFHAVIAKKQKEWVITDTFSKTGVLVNNEKIEGSATIDDGDKITIGDITLKFQCAEALSHELKTRIRKETSQTNNQVNRNVAYAVLVESQTHKPIYLKKKDVLIGRDDDCDIQIDLATVSGKHARIHKTSRGWALSDLKSLTGTKLNGRYITEPQLIFDMDMITFGTRVFIFYEQ